MGEGFPFSNLDTNFPTTSYMTTPQLSSLAPDSAPNTVFEIITVIQVGFFGYRIRTIYSKTLFFLGFSQFAIAYPSLGFTRVDNLLDANLSIWEAHPLLSLGKLYTSVHSSTVHTSRSLLNIPSHLLERSRENSLTISSLLRLQGWMSKPSQSIHVKSSTNIIFSTSS